MKTFEFTHIMEGIGSNHRGIMETYTTSFNSKYHKLEIRAWLVNQRIGFTNGERTSKGIEYEGRYQIKSNKGSGGPQGI